MAEALAAVHLQHGNHMDFPHPLLVDCLSPCTGAAHGLSATCCEEETVGLEPGILNQLLSTRLNCKRPVNCPMDRGMREDPGSVRVQEAASGSPVRVGFQFAGASSAISVMFMSGNLLRTSVR